MRRDDSAELDDFKSKEKDAEGGRMEKNIVFCVELGNFCISAPLIMSNETRPCVVTCARMPPVILGEGEGDGEGEEEKEEGVKEGMKDEEEDSNEGHIIAFPSSPPLLISPPYQ